MNLWVWPLTWAGTNHPVQCSSHNKRLVHGLVLLPKLNLVRPTSPTMWEDFSSNIQSYWTLGCIFKLLANKISRRKVVTFIFKQLNSTEACNDYWFASKNHFFTEFSQCLSLSVNLNLRQRRTTSKVEAPVCHVNWVHWKPNQFNYLCCVWKTKEEAASQPYKKKKWKTFTCLCAAVAFRIISTCCNSLWIIKELIDRIKAVVWSIFPIRFFLHSYL